MENYGELMVICQSFPPYDIHIVVIQVIFPLRRNKNKTAQAIPSIVDNQTVGYV